MNYQDINAETIDRWIAEGWEWSIPGDHETFVAAQAGRWGLLLTSTTPVPHDWFGNLHRKNLGLTNGINFILSGDNEREIVNSLPFKPLKHPEQLRQIQADDCGIQFSTVSTSRTAVNSGQASNW